MSPTQSLRANNVNKTHSQVPKYIDQKLNYEHHLRPHSSQANRYMLEKKHQSLFVENNNTTAPMNSPYHKACASSTDYLCNSETVYRNEILKSIRNVLQKNQQIRPSTLSGSSMGITSVTTNIASTSRNLDTKTPAQMQSVSNDMPPTPQTPPNNYYQQHHQHKYVYQQQNPSQNNNSIYNSTYNKGGVIASGVYLTSSGPQIVDTFSSTKTPSIKQASAIHQSSRLTNRPAASSYANIGDQTANVPDKDHARSVLYLDRDSTSSIEYESRV